MADFLKTILDVKCREVEALRAACTLDELQAAAAAASPVRGFAASLVRRAAAGDPAVIAEVKRASPSKGVIRANFDPAEVAQAYESAGAACLSVLTDREFFQGSPEIYRAARAAVAIPALRKDFIIDPLQVWESRAMGADAILLIMRAVDDALARKLYDLAVSLGMDVLIETHDAEEIERALKLPGALIGINNRNLNTFVTDIAQTVALRDRVPAGRLVVSESGIAEPEHVMTLKQAGVTGFLVGESLMRGGTPAASFRRLFGGWSA